MVYSLSKLDEDNFNWFQNRDDVASLKRIRIAIGQIRGLRKLDVEFQYPITAIAGKNGSGKSTILALAACAFHNRDSGFNPFGQKESYYTFSDFFVQTKEEVPLEGIAIYYSILHNNWAKTGRGLGHQIRKKKHGGRWTNYDRRVNRDVVFLGIDRVVPHSEKSVSKSYRRNFRKTQSVGGWEAEVRETVGRILGQSYDAFWYKEYSRYRLPVVESKGNTYTGFNMGAGENALFEIFSIIQTAPKGTLFVVDEIELGLHEEAQAKLIEELKKVCKQKSVQIICTTHSARVLDCLPPEGRIFLERFGDQTVAITGIAPDFAMGKLAGQATAELSVYVEDVVAQGVIPSVVSNDIRQRINIIPFGSAAAIMRYLGGIYKDSSRRDEVCAILDGDQRTSEKKHINNFAAAVETYSDKHAVEAWIKERLCFLPGTEWPEKWILSRNIDGFRNLETEFGVTSAELENFIERALQAKKHSEFWTLSKKLNYPEDIVRARFTKCAFEANLDETKRIASFIADLLT